MGERREDAAEEERNGKLKFGRSEKTEPRKWQKFGNDRMKIEIRGNGREITDDERKREFA